MNIKDYVNGQLRRLSWSDLFDREDFVTSLLICMGWSLSGCAYWVVVNHLPHVGNTPYLLSAAQEGMSAILWNVMAVIGFMASAIALLFPRWDSVAGVARHVLMTTFGMGALMLGLLLAQAVAQDSGSALVGWRSWMFDARLTVLFLAAYTFNFGVWYFASLMSDRSRREGFLHKMSTVSIRVRAPVALALMVIGLVSLVVPR